MSPSFQALFKEKVAAQVAAYFLFQARGRMPVLKLMKLMYLAERRSFEKFGEPLVGDKLVSMEHGPVLSRTLNFINGMVPSEEGGWESWVSDREGHDVALRDASLIRSPEQDLPALSDGDLEVLAEVWAQFGHWDKYKLRDYTHDHCPEWQDPDASSLPISYEALFAALKFSPEKSAGLMEHLQELAAIESAFRAPLEPPAGAKAAASASKVDKLH
jgi:uncharacterized phage-associated protein